MMIYDDMLCIEPGCGELATFITMADGRAAYFCEYHGKLHRLERGIPLTAEEKK